ncbi:ABC transporter ATP-binding protein [Petrocella atlantisensis]|uniref:ABC transporter ATP-binding protein n=1 Tax=Petrocella atlantisensis TaxID=2173034 RepID=A0A3P7PJJ7_9FIRM|nr:transglutaminase family protein [Petrocella atlantisensis]VDN49128.1 ABC transporter ATP-binding protein [Petrocella atlantisensis]
MDLNIESNDINDYLKSSTIINFDDQSIVFLAEEICKNKVDDVDRIKAVFEYVRDKIDHSADVNGSAVTCNASEVLKFGEGICYAKSHLLAALLRYHGIPTGFCYQRLLLSDDKQYLIIHGLNGVYVKSLDRWIRLDARGNKLGVNSEFSIEVEKLAFQVDENQGEEDILIVYKEPDSNVISALHKYDTVEELFNNLPCNLSDN